MHRFLLPILGLLMVACATETVMVNDGVDHAAIDIGDLTRDGLPVQSMTTPDGYAQGDRLVAYEGPGWESDKVGYRLYLDSRNAVDIFGKRTPDLILSTVGRGDDYHEMADWGMDILKVGNSLGAGGFGVYRNGEAVQIGDAARYKAEVIEDTNERATLRVTHEASQACGDNIVADYTITGGSRLTDVKIFGDCVLPIAAGLVIHPETTRAQVRGGEWAAVLRYGSQSLVPDALALVLFYKPEDVAIVADDKDDSYIVFKDAIAPHYKFAAVWAQEPNAPRIGSELLDWVDQTLTQLNQ